MVRNIREATKQEIFYNTADSDKSPKISLDVWVKTDNLVLSYLFDDPFAALISSSAKHSAIVLMFLKADSRAPVVRR